MRFDMRKTLLILLVGILSLASVFAYDPLTGEITEIEKYGHVVLDVTIEEAAAAGYELGDAVTVVFDNGYTFEDIPYYDGYYVAMGDPVLRAYPGDECIAVCINFGKVFEVANVGIGDTATITMAEKEGYLVDYELNSLVYSDDRADYGSNEVFANFRAIVPGKLYRSASPVNNEHGRAAYGDAFAEAVGINGVLNLADTYEDVESFIAEEGFASDYYKALYDNGAVIALGMPVAFATEDFGNTLAAGIEDLSELDPPYLIHCTEGKDRAGFVSALFECLLGFSYDEVVDDFMLSFDNYYGVNEENDARKYGFIFDNNIAEMLPVITGGENPQTADLSECAADYLLSHGMSEEALSTLMDKLTK